MQQKGNHSLCNVAMASTNTPKKSKIWEYFTKTENNRVQCNLCKKEYVYGTGTGNFWTHLQNKHRIINNESKVFLNTQAAEHRNAQQGGIGSFFKPQKSYEFSSKKHQDITLKVAKLFVKEMLPLQKIESEAWKELFHELDNRYEVPDVKYLKKVTQSLFASAQETVKQSVKELLFHSITCDTWTSKANDGFTAVSAHGIDENWEIKDYVVAVEHIKERHTATFLAQQLQGICSQFGITDPVAVSDSGANIKKAIANNNWDRFPCVAHILNLAVRAGLNVPGVQEVVGKCKNIVTFFKHSSHATANLRANCELLKEAGDPVGKCQQLIQEVPTRWNSCFKMLQRLLILRKAIMGQITREEHVLYPSQWTLIEQIVEVLEPIKVISEVLCGVKYPTMSFTFPAIMELVNVKLASESPSSTIAEFKAAIKQNLEDHLQDQTQRNIMEVCGFIDPRFKHLEFLSAMEKENCEELVQKIARKLRDNTETEVTFKDSDCGPQKRKFEEIESDDEDGPSSKKFALMFGDKCVAAARKCHSTEQRNKVLAEMERYKAEDVLAMTKSPLKWWKVNESRYPILALVAKKYLGIPASSVPCERVFSQAGQIVTKQRAGMSPGTAEMMVFLKAFYS